MRTQQALAIVSLTSFAAGAMIVTALTQNSLPIMASVTPIALLTGLLGVGWAIMRFRKGFERLNHLTSTRRPEFSETGIEELDLAAQKFTQCIESIQNTRHTDTQDLNDVKQVLKSLDRREGSVDRDGNPITPANQLRSIVKGYRAELDSTVRQAVSCGREIHRATEELVGGSEEQSDVVNQTASFVEQLSSQILWVDDNTKELLSNASTAQEHARDGLSHFQQLIDEMKQIRNHAAARERKLQVLGQHTKEIESIVQTIGSLSSRTDLLALNASIESVRAGEHGRGFAVVAEEVRTLAEQSAQAVVDITKRIEMIQLETHQSISVASGEHDQMHQVIQRVSDTLEFLRNLALATDASSNKLDEIADTTTNQLQLTQQLIATLEKSSESSKLNRSRAEGAHWTAKTFWQVSSQLENTLGLFRLSDEPDSNPVPQSSPNQSELESAESAALVN